MTPKERVLAALRHREPDRVPTGEFATDYSILEQALGRPTFWRAKRRYTEALWDGRRDEVVEGLKRDDGWVDMQVQFLIDKKSADADHVVGWTMLKPGARHENHRHHNCDEFFIVLKGHGMIYTDHGDTPSVEGDVVYSPRGCWHGFNNTSNEDVVLVWGWMGAGSIEASGYEVHPESHKK